MPGYSAGSGTIRFRLSEEHHEKLRAKAALESRTMQDVARRFVEDGLDGEKPNTNYSGDFERFWAAYPLKKGKLSAYRVWQRMKKRPPLGELLEAIERSKLTREWKEGYVVYAERWLKNARFDDEAPELPAVLDAVNPDELTAPEAIDFAERVTRGLVQQYGQQPIIGTLQNFLRACNSKRKAAEAVGRVEARLAAPKREEESDGA